MARAADRKAPEAHRGQTPRPPLLPMQLPIEVRMHMPPAVASKPGVWTAVTEVAKCGSVDETPHNLVKRGRDPLTTSSSERTSQIC